FAKASAWQAPPFAKALAWGPRTARSKVKDKHGESVPGPTRNRRRQRVASSGTQLGSAFVHDPRPPFEASSRRSVLMWWPSRRYQRAMVFVDDQRRQRTWDTPRRRTQLRQAR